MREGEEGAARRLADGTPLADVLDTGSAAAWIALDLGIREEIRWGRCRAPSHAWFRGRRLRQGGNSPLPSLNPSRTPPDASALAATGSGLTDAVLLPLLGARPGRVRAAGVTACAGPVGTTRPNRSSIVPPGEGE
ncbi:hypothetical protein ACIPPS_25775 [Streptomyces sp. NPDC090127]|uniref:hypothetical protein n=1 Tax=Streptomyces sp. NPDC090127 TaxID=3365953 RepID=UPI0037FA0D69